MEGVCTVITVVTAGPAAAAVVVIDGDDDEEGDDIGGISAEEATGTPVGVAVPAVVGGNAVPASAAASAKSKNVDFISSY